MLDEFVGQKHFIGQGKLLRRMLQADALSSLIFYGPPGVGKTSLANVIANHTRARFCYLSAPAATMITASTPTVVRRLMAALDSSIVGSSVRLDGSGRDLGAVRPPARAGPG